MKLSHGTRRGGVAAALVIAAALAIPSAASAASVIVVDTTADENGGAGGSGCSLREALASANTNSNFGGCSGSGGGSPFTVEVPAGTYSLSLGELRVGAASGTTTSIVGAGAGVTTVRQSGASCTSGTARVFSVDPNVVGNVAVSISGLTISNGAAQLFGGGAILGGGTNDVLTVADAVISGNCAPGTNGGAGIAFSPAGTLVVSNTTFAGNFSNSVGGALFLTSSGATTITGSTFVNNRAGAAGNAGGAVFLGSGSATTNIDGSTFEGNAAPGSAATGGAIYVNGGRLNLGTVAANVFTGNTAGTAATGALSVGGRANVAAANNWWGCNSGPDAPTCDRAAAGINALLDFEPWVVLRTSHDPDTIAVNQSATITADFLRNSEGAALTPAQVRALVGRAVSWSNAVGGDMSNADSSIRASGSATAVFTGAAAGTGSVDAAVDAARVAEAVSVTQAGTHAFVTAHAPATSTEGEAVTVRFDVSSDTGSSPTAPTGSVKVTDGVDSCTASLAAGECSLALTTVGARRLTASYSGDANFLPSTSPEIDHDVQPAKPPTDTTPPVVSDVRVSEPDGQHRGRPRVLLSWRASDDRTAVSALVFEIQRRHANGRGDVPWVALATVTGETALDQLPARPRLDYRVRARDEAGNWSDWEQSPG
jgi:CSLREA domain-containing protein